MFIQLIKNPREMSIFQSIIGVRPYNLLEETVRDLDTILLDTIYVYTWNTAWEK